MRITVFALFTCLATSAFAADVAVVSRVDAVTVFPQGAEVKRVAKVRILKGTHRLIFKDLPSQTIVRSIRVEGKSSGGLEIGAVDGRRVSVLRNESAQADRERKRLEAELEQLGDELSVLKATLEAKNVQRQFITNLTALPGRPAPQGAANENWSAVFDLIGGRLADLQRVMQETNLKIRAVTRKMADLKKQLQQLAPAPVVRTELALNVVAAQDLEAELTVIYQVHGASWTPLYDARLETGSRSVPAKLVLTRRAEVRQSTDEAWDKVSVSLSTTRPSARSVAPTLSPLIVDFVPPPPPAAEAASTRRRMYDRSRVQGRAAVRSEEAPAAVPMPKKVVMRGARAFQGAFQAIFRVPDRITVQNTGDVSRVKISDMTLEPALTVRAVPKREARAYLYAKIKLPRTAPYLPGPIALFRDQTFTGFGRLPQLAPGETHEIGFGADDLVRVRYEVVTQKKGETGLISSSRTDQRRYKIVIKNMHERPIAYTLLDQLPVSADEKIKVELNGGNAPTERDVKDQRGVVAWTGKLAADEEKVLNFGYIVSWPSDKQVHYR
ncbi:MAG: mucoidy inhibitor MuiA family protein [Hyphomicrobiaceae bacterium]|nr:mucoidy inhibitor MuiA family protein [Hyphomicrobiaceae bacterium]